MVGSRMVEPLWGDPAMILPELLVDVLEQEVGESDNEEDERIPFKFSHYQL